VEEGTNAANLPIFFAHSVLTRYAAFWTLLLDPEDGGIGAFRGALYKRKDFLDTEEAGAYLHWSPFGVTPVSCVLSHAVAVLPAAKSHPNRTYYYRKNGDVNGLIESCSKKVRNPLPFLPSLVADV
jgi:hypothetical protein